MQSFCITLKPLSAFATSMKGDTLFGQLCWAIHNRYGQQKLSECLQGYTQGQPFAVLSDAFPTGYLPLPKLPSSCYHIPDNQDRKAVKKLSWLPQTAFAQPVCDWLTHAVNSSTVAGQYSSSAQNGTPAYRNLSEPNPQPHNTINRRSNTTGETGFTPYSIEQEWFIPGLSWSVYVLLDDNRLNPEQCRQCLEDIGAFGYGKDASIGLGKYQLTEFTATPLPAQDHANACLTLAPCAPQGLGYDSEHSYYQLFTRFGRHGDIAVHQTGQPFKNPILLAQTGAFLLTDPPKSGFLGQGIGVNGALSKTLEATVHQGYAPILPILFNKGAS